ncbi:MAG: DUF2147 domain-containing protein [Saprospiraceae bacterium]|jgi:uncharacterized protein (DUF2147 family)|nr:DUF2147 domain-containing protein [Saprospiraceae bacterium]MBP9208783.1 DUF2147 domain-containing protein [Saprospiraceae bacterium]MBV6472345.1 hypothetical protein [Saprospiraceae bacterium]
MMKKIFQKRVFALYLSLAFFAGGAPAQGSEVEGRWLNVDAKTGTWLFVAECYRVDGHLHIRVVELPESAGVQSCQNCPEPFKGRALEGMDIVWGLRKSADGWDRGKIIDPESGKIYDCAVWLDKGGALNVRGYLKMKLFGKTQRWERPK